MGVIPIKKLDGGLNLQEASTIGDNQFKILNNMSYNADKRLMSRRGIALFGNTITGNKPITSSFFYDDQKNNIRVLIASSGADLWLYNEGTGNWSSIKSGLSEFEADGVTRTRWSFAVLREKIYLCNGVDSYAEYGPVASTYTALLTQPKPRYLVYLADAIYAGGVDANPSTLYVTNAIGATAADGRTIDANQLFIGGGSSGRINIIEELQSSVLVHTDKKIYKVAGDLTSALPIDAENGGYGNRAVKRVGNSLLYFNDRGFTTLRTKTGVTGTSALQDEPLSDDIRELTSKVKPRRYNSTIGEYILPLTNYYGSIDTNDDDICDTTLVYSSLTRGWSQHTLPAHYDFCQYKDNDGVWHYLIASANSGQMMEIETGFDDLGSQIDVELETKSYDLGDPTNADTYKYVTLTGLKSEGDDITIKIKMEGTIVAEGIVTDAYIDVSKSLLSIGETAIGTIPVGGGEITSTEIDLYRYIIRIPLYELSNDIAVNMTSSSKSLVWSLDRISINVDSEDTDVFSYANIG